MTALAMLLCVGWLTACETEPEVGEDIAPEVEDVEEDPEDYIGQTVTLRGEINDLHDANAFTIEDEGLNVFDGELLVIVPTTADVTGATTTATRFNEDDEVQVDGTVRRYVGIEMQDEFGLDPTWAVNYEQEPVLIADRVQIIERADTTTVDGAGVMDDAMSSANEQ